MPLKNFVATTFFTRAIDVAVMPSASTLRQRMDTHEASWFKSAGEFNLAVLSAKYATGSLDFVAMPCGYKAEHWDIFVMNNSGTQKQAVGRTYQGVSGYAPSATYLGSLVYCLAMAIRPGPPLAALCDGN